MKVLVTGHKGYIGSKLYAELKKLDYDVVGIDLKDGKSIDGCLPNQQFDCVFHLAALPSVQFSVERPCYSLKNNVFCTSLLLNWAKNHGVRTFVFSSSAAAANPSSPYGLQKRMSEMECKLYSELYGLNTVSLRYFNVYSEDQPFSGAYSTVISSWMHMIRTNRPLRIDGNGEQTRDFIHVDDVVRCNISCIGSKNLLGNVLDVGTGKSVSLKFIKNKIDS